MAQKMYHESGNDGRSVLGMLEVQVERDQKTGATVVRSVAPASSPVGSPNATTIFDDGRKSIHTVGGSPGQPSTQELSQILSAIDGVGMKVLLDEVTVTPNKAETKTKSGEDRKHLEEDAVPFTSHYNMSKDENIQLGSSRTDQAKTSVEKFAVNVSKPDHKSTITVKNFAEQVEYIEDKRLEEGPVTLMFMGYTDDARIENPGQENDQSNIKVERVMITDNGEERVLGPEPESPSERVAQQNDGKEAPSEVFQDVPLEGRGAGGKVQGAEGSKSSSSPSGAKRKTCQCCSVM